MCEGGKMAWPGTEAMERPRPQWNKRQNGQEGCDPVDMGATGSFWAG